MIAKGGTTLNCDNDITLSSVLRSQSVALNKTDIGRNVRFYLCFT